MPYFSDPNLEDEQNKQQSQSGGGFSVSGAAPSGGGGGQGAGGAGAQASGSSALKTGSGFQNLDKYITANQGNQLGQNVLGKVGSQVTDAQQNMKTAADQFKNQVNTANALPSQDQINSVIANAGKAKSDTYDPSKDQADYQNWMNQTYQGPKTLADNSDTWNQYWGKSNQANTSAQQLGSEAGRFSLLDQYFGKPSYNFGEKSLDNLLVQNSGLGQQTHNLQNQATALQGQGAAQAKQLQGLASQRQADVSNSNNMARSAIGVDAQGNVLTGDKAGALGQSYDQVDQEVAKANDLATGQYNDFLSQLQKNAHNASNYGVDPTQYLHKGADLTKDQIMSPEERSRIQALSQLSGVTDNYANGTAQDKTDAYTLDKAGLNNAYQAAQSNYNSELAAMNAQMSKSLYRADSPFWVDRRNQLRAKYGLPAGT